MFRIVIVVYADLNISHCCFKSIYNNLLLDLFSVVFLGNPSTVSNLLCNLLLV